MRILVVCARYPESGGRGDQVRVMQQTRLLAPGHAVTVVTGGAPSGQEAQRALEALATVCRVQLLPSDRVRGALRGLAVGHPLEVGLMTPAPLRRAAVRAAGECDVALISTIRCMPGSWPLPTVLDHIDALSANLRERARLARNPVLRLGTWLESGLLARHERRVRRWILREIVVSVADAAALGGSPPPEVVPLVWEGPVDSGECEAPRDIDVIFTGNMRYPPNRDAALWFAREIVPRLRSRRPDARVMVAGRSAAELPLQGVEVASDVPDLMALLRRAKVAAVPLRSGTGIPIKLMEAVAGGAAIVSTPRVASAFGFELDTAHDAEGLAVSIERLLASEPLRLERVASLRAALAGQRADAVRELLEGVLASAARRPR